MKFVTLMKGNAPTVTTCAAACTQLKGMIATNAQGFSAKNITASATLNYFRCYSFENGNNENANNINLSGEDVNCDPGIIHLRSFLFFVYKRLQKVVGRNCSVRWDELMQGSFRSLTIFPHFYSPFLIWPLSYIPVFDIYFLQIYPNSPDRPHFDLYKKYYPYFSNFRFTK